MASSARQINITSSTDTDGLRAPLRAAMIEASMDILCVIDGDHVFREANATYCKLLGRACSEVVDQPVRKVVGDDFYGQVLVPRLKQAVTEGEVQYIAPRHFEGGDCFLEIRYRVLDVDSPFPAPLVLVVARDITLRLAEQEKLARRANTDPLTGVTSRCEFLDVTAAAVAQCTDQRHRHTLTFLDLDRFKIINDACGHSAGDQVLCDVANIINDRKRASDVLARVGGDEFALLSYDCTPQQQLRVLNDIGLAVADYRFHYSGRSFSLGVSGGLARIDESVADEQEAIRRADSACQRAKAEGRHRFIVFDSMDEDAPETIADVLGELNDDRLQLSFQRIERVSPHSAEARSVEALVRLLDADGNALPAADFIADAERYGIIERIDRWVLDKVLETFRSAEVAEQVDTVWVNVSRTSIASAAFRDYALDAIAARALPRCRLGFEVPEQAFIDSTDTVEQFVTTMYDAGVLIAVDNFGSNLAALDRITRLPIDCLKFHQDLVRRLAGDPALQDLITACIRIADSNGMKTAASYVEDARTAAWVHGSGIDFAQGYAISRPVHLLDLLGHEQPA